MGLLPLALELLAFLDFWTCRFDSARAHADEGLRLALHTGQENPTFVHHTLLALAAAVRGEEDLCREQADTALRGAIARDLRLAINLAHLALGQLELGLGRPAEALERLERLSEPGSNWSVRRLGVPDLVEAAVRAGEPERARPEVDAFERWAVGTESQWALPVLARCQALLARAEDAESHFHAALELHRGYLLPFEQARTELLYGEFLRRAKRRADARPHLRSATETFASLGASLWEERASSELRATGETARRRDPSALWQLTPQELQIARSVASGWSNREVAAHYFLSPRTVEYHLRKVFAKLRISSRAELTGLSFDGEPPAEARPWTPLREARP